ncbi:MAG: hypothetical protein F4060_04700 [Holophagales bacterium]|nr:hypothetical protein [Holophagales bacterium]MYG29804.1 hypothetical protein [Holophagales bacterium]MYI79218.1 hypothetical protein [Holophagales bacterium]
MCAAAVAATLAGCGPEPVQQNLTIEFVRDHESGGAMEIRAEVSLDRDAADQDDEELQNRIDEIAAELADGTSVWHERFDRLQAPASDGFDLRRDEGEVSGFQRWAVLKDPGPALADFFADTRIAPTYTVSDDSATDTGATSAPGTVTLSFRAAGDADPSSDELTNARRALLEVAHLVVRLQGTVDEVWSYLEEHPQKRRSWIAFLAFADEEALNELETDLSEEEEELWERLLEDTFAALWPEDAIEGEPLAVLDPLRRALDDFPAQVSVKPDGEVIEAVGFLEAKDAYIVSAGDISWAIANTLEDIVSPNFTDFWAHLDWEGLFRGSQAARAVDAAECDRDCQLDEILARPFVVRPAQAPEIAEALEKALTPLGEYRLRWIRDP